MALLLSPSENLIFTDIIGLLTLNLEAYPGRAMVFTVPAPVAVFISPPFL